ncbi:MAG: TolC family protein, partial [Gemmatimonadetes bacterium]|nr:TolC family protein [Gemmatimonadota bacterium]
CECGVWGLVVNLSQPVLRGGRLRAGVDLAEANREQAVARFAQQVLLACGEVESALGADAYLARQESALRRAAEEAAAARRLARERYDRGLADLIALLEAQRRTYEAESQLASVRRQRLDNRTDLHLALGGDISAEALARFQSEFN